MLGKTNSSVGSKINNMDLFVTDNGVYSAPDGFTGLGVVEVNVPKGEQVTAINKTGSTIIRGQKVWLNENQQTQGSSYSIENVANGTPAAASGALSRTGNFAWRNGKLFSLGGDSATKVGDFSFSNGPLCIKYGLDNSVLIMYAGNSCRVDEKTQYTIGYRHIRDNYFMSNGYSVVQVDMETGNIINTLGNVATSNANVFMVNDVFYTADGYKYVYNGASFDRTFTTVVNQGTFYPIDVTSDNRYVIGSTTANYSNQTNGALRILEVIDEDNLKILTQAEMPEDLQDFYANNCFVVFNPYTGILTAVKNNTSDYVVMKYENGSWTKLPIDLGITEPLKGSLTLSDDLTRGCIAYGSTGSWYAYIINLQTTSGYSAVPYRFYTITEQSQTGFAGNDVEPDGEVIVGIGSVPQIDNTGTKDNPKPVTVEEFIAASEENDTWYQLTGKITNIANTNYGNFYINDGTGSVYIYGMTSTPVDANDKSFSSIGLKVGDTLTFATMRGSYNGEPQGGQKNGVPAYYISHIAYMPITEPLTPATLDENYIDLTQVTNIGDVFLNANNEPVATNLTSLTETSGATLCANSLFGSEDKLIADEFVMRFHFSDRVYGDMMKQFVYLFGETSGNASDGGNYWDGTDRTNQFNICFGYDVEYNWKTFGVDTGWFDENGNTVPMTVTDWGNEIEFGWNTVRMYFNGDIWILSINDSLEYSIPPLPKVCKPYNLNQFINNFGAGDNCVDLAETGFKLNGEWVWRAVK